MPTVTPPKTLLVTSADPGLMEELGTARPDLRVAYLGANFWLSPAAEPAFWCFVDWLLPNTSGLEMVRRLRHGRATRSAHITMVLDRADSDERRRALNAGADDYMIGPLNAAALLDRLSLYELDGQRDAKSRARLCRGDLAIDMGAHQVRWKGRPIGVRPNEFRLLAHFMEHPDQVFSRSTLIDRLGKDDDRIDERTVDVWVGRLRRALAAHGAPDPLRTVRALGYVMDSLDN